MRAPHALASAALHATRAELQAQWRANAFGEPLVIEVKESPDRIAGDVYAELPYAFGVVGAALRTPAALCELLFLHLNVHGCVPREANLLEVLAGPKKSGGAGMTAQMRYSVRIEADAPEHLRVVLAAPTGPLSTTDYRMVFEAVPLDEAACARPLRQPSAKEGLAGAVLTTYRLEAAAAGADRFELVVEGRRERIDPDGQRIQPAARYRAASQGAHDVFPACGTDHLWPP